MQTPQPPHADYTAHHIATAINVDGNLQKPEWQSARWSKRFCDMVNGAPGMFNTQVAILWNDEHLYFAFKAEEPFVEARLKVRLP